MVSQQISIPVRDGARVYPADDEYPSASATSSELRSQCLARRLARRQRGGNLRLLGGGAVTARDRRFRDASLPQRIANRDCSADARVPRGITCLVPSRWLRECRPSGLRRLLGLNLCGKNLLRSHPPRIQRRSCLVLQECVLLRQRTLTSSAPETQPHLPSGALLFV